MWKRFYNYRYIFLQLTKNRVHFLLQNVIILLSKSHVFFFKNCYIFYLCKDIRILGVRCMLQTIQRGMDLTLLKNPTSFF